MHKVRDGKTIRVLIADSSPLFREALANLLRTAETVHLNVRSTTVDCAVSAARLFSPEVILLDIGSASISFEHLIEALKQASAEASIVALAESADEPRVLDALRAGVRGYILRNADRAQLLDAVRNAAQGCPSLPPLIARRALSHHFPYPSDPAPGTADGRLSALEVKMLKLMTQGRTNRQMAEWLGLSERTIARRVSQIYVKLVVTDRSAAIVEAIKSGIVSI